MWQTHDHTFLVISILIFFLALVLLGGGIGIIQGSSSQIDIDYLEIIDEMYSGQTANYLSPVIHLSEHLEFDIPTSYLDKTVPLKLNFIASSDSYFTQNTLFEFNITASFNQKDMEANGIAIIEIQAYFLEATDVSPNDFTPTGFTVTEYYSSRIFLKQQNQEKMQSWIGNDYFTFKQNGTILCEIRIKINRDYSNSTLVKELNTYLSNENKTFQNEVSFGYRFSNFSVKSFSDLNDYQRANLQSMANLRQQLLQVKLQALQTALFQQAQVNQEINEGLNLGFTFLVLFLAVLEISFKIFEYSKDEQLEKDYEYKKRYEKQKDII